MNWLVDQSYTHLCSLVLIWTNRKSKLPVRFLRWVLSLSHRKLIARPSLTAKWWLGFIEQYAHLTPGLIHAEKVKLFTARLPSGSSITAYEFIEFLKKYAPCLPPGILYVYICYKSYQFFDLADSNKTLKIWYYYQVNWTRLCWMVSWKNKTGFGKPDLSEPIAQLHRSIRTLKTPFIIIF